jgi:hypothetical protein
MRYRILDAAGDMTFGHQQQNFYRDQPEAVAQAVLTRLKLWAGEWFLDQSDGTPYQQAALGMRTQQSLDPAMRARILQTPGVLSLDLFSLFLDPNARHISIGATITTIYGTTRVTGVV